MLQAFAAPRNDSAREKGDDVLASGKPAAHRSWRHPAPWRRHHAEVTVSHRSGEMYRLPAVRDGLFLRAQRGTINPSKSRIKVFNFEHEGRKVPYTCTQCADAWCLNACPVDAIRHRCCRRRQGVHRHLCRLQGMHHRLPVRHRQLHGHVGKVQKCDLCGGDPKCATACPTGAITHVDADWTGLDRMRAWAARPTPPSSCLRRRRPWDGTEKSCA